MVNKLSNDVLNELISQVVRKDAVPLVNLIRGKKNVSEIKIAEKLKLTVNQVRSMLYGLSAQALVTSIRRKDKKKGWYVYFWNLDENAAFKLKEAVNVKKLKELKDQLKLEEKVSYFVCPDECERISNDDALECGYKCPECGKLMMQESNISRIIKIKEEIKKIETELAQYRLEVQKELEKKVKKIKKKAPKKVKKKIRKFIKRIFKGKKNKR
ncbi:hypothetical protein HY498_00215 [Candidatus Woesearchaeota archaeon]|nr:hypothetical protein [Candidatus Woesearchaeota archaeon]